MSASFRRLAPALVALSLFVIAILPLFPLSPAASAAANETDRDGLSRRQQQGGPAGAARGARPLETVDTLSMPAVDAAALMREDVDRAREGLPPRFAYPIPVEVSAASRGTWEFLNDGTRLWRLRIISKGARSLNVGFARYEMPAGGKMYLYTPNLEVLRGPFTEADNEVHGEFWSPILPGGNLVIEVQLPPGAAPVALELASVNHGYAEFGTRQAHLSGACNLDVACGAADGYPQVDAWRGPIQSVGVYSVEGFFSCSGALINNSASDLTPYFLTALHCGITEENAPSVVVYWNYENSTCRIPGSADSGNPGDGDLSQFNSGAILRAGYTASDFSLIELDDPVDPSTAPFWAGWDVTGNAPESAVAIHHPNTDEKRISFENDPLSVTSYLGDTSPGDGTHLKVEDWDIGTTEPGSSGSPLFSPAQHIVGQLGGGFAACGNDEPDWYGRLFTSWEGGGTPDTRLKDWLDPLDTGTQVLDGRGGAPDFALVATPARGAACVGGSTSYQVIVNAIEGFSDPVNLSLSGAPAASTATFEPNPAAPTSTSMLTLQVGAASPAGQYQMSITGMAPTSTHTTTVHLTLADNPPGVVTLNQPEDGAVDVQTRPTFTWMEGSQVVSYTLEIATDAAFENVILPRVVEGTHFELEDALEPLTTYYWRVNASNACGVSEPSPVRSFTTLAEYCSEPALAIPDFDEVGVADTLSIPDTGTLSDVNVYLRVDHTWVGDLIVTLEHGETSVLLANRPDQGGCVGRLDALLDDDAAQPIQSSCDANGLTSGPYGPAMPLAAFNGLEQSGDWTLTVSDNAGFDTGELVRWCVQPQSGATAVTVDAIAARGGSNLLPPALLLLLTLVGLGLTRARRRAR